MPVLAVAGGMSGAAEAGCSQSGTTVTCTGDPGGISYTQDDSVVDIVVDDLTANIDGGSGSAISLIQQGDDASGDDSDGFIGDDGTVSITGTTGSASYGITGDAGYGGQVLSAGGAGAVGAAGNDDVGADDGGVGGAAGDVSFTMTGGWIDYTGGDAGVSVTSTGGAGGQGGEDKVGTVKASAGADGGDGGAGGDAGTASVALDTLSDADGETGVTVSGAGIGIEVLSAGGAGGEGGEAYCENKDAGFGCTAWSGRGGDGGNGAAATLAVTDTDVSITDFSTVGITVSSTGGDGGKGGLAKVSYGGDVFNNFQSTSGKGGDGGDADEAVLSLTGSATTVTDDSSQAAYGVSVLSAGGDGGDGNDLEGFGSCDYVCQPGFGDGGAGGAGGTASLTLSDSDLTISVSADDAAGLYVASTGGDGGNIGTVNTTSSKVWGGSEAPGTPSGGNGGDAGAVTVNMDSASTLKITTTGSSDLNGALTLWSRGGYGGDGGSGGTYGDGDGGDGGDGGDITGTLGSIDITTSGDGATGALLWTAGGSGGTGSSSDGDGGSGGNIDIAIDDASITTTGDSAHGIYATSIGAVGGDSSSDGDAGSAGSVDLTVSDGSIVVEGSDSTAIRAISLTLDNGSGDGSTSGDVSVTTGADITASGADSIGIYVKSAGSVSAGTLSVTVDTGGSVTASGSGSTAVAFDEGDGNTLINDGTITTSDLSSTSILALSASKGQLSVTNNGIFGGSVSLDNDYENTFTNSSGATLNLGATFDLGEDGTLTSAGTLSPGGSGSILTSTVTGTTTQSSAGTYLVDVDGDVTDHIVFNSVGTVLDGTVSVNVVSATSGSGSSPIAASDDSIDSGLTVTNTAVASYTVTTGTTDTVVLNWNFDFANDSILGAANSNQSATTQHIDSVLTSIAASNDATSPGDEAGARHGKLDASLTGLINIVAMDEYLSALDTLHSQIHADNRVAALFSSLQFSESLLTCGAKDGAFRFARQDQCVWFAMGGRHLTREADRQSRGFDQSIFEMAGGGQVAFGADDSWTLGGAVSWESQDLKVANIAKSEGDLFQGGIVLGKRFGNTVLSASLSGGSGSYDVDRTIYTGDTAWGTQDLRMMTGQVAAEHTFAREAWYLKPRVDVGFDTVSMDAFRERGAGGVSLIADSASGTTWHVRPSVELGVDIVLGGGAVIRPGVTVGLTQLLGDTAPTVTAKFASTPAGVGGFTISSPLDDTYLDVGASVDIFATDRVSISLDGAGQYSDSIESYGGSARLGVRF